jgi:hypothetical protein
MIAGLAVVSLSYPRGRRNNAPSATQRQGRRLDPDPEPEVPDPERPADADTGEFERPQIPVR